MGYGARGELLGFPNAKHDDQVDAVVQAISYTLAAERYTNQPASIIVNHYGYYRR